MVINKNSIDARLKETNREKLSKYRTQAKCFIAVQQKRKKQEKHFSKSGLAYLIPFAAASLSPFSAFAQPCPNSPVGANTQQDINCGGVTATTVDLDGGGDDVVFFYTSFGFLIRQATASSMTFARTVNGTYRYLIGYDIGTNIDVNSGNFGSLKPQNLNQCTSTQAYGWLDYENYGTGGWDGLTGGTKVMGLTKDGFLGFIEILYDDNDTNANTQYTIGEFGLANNTSIDIIEAGNCSSTVLPVELVSFRGIMELGGFNLKWHTASELNNLGFEIQRSTDGVEFYKIGWVEGVGNSTENNQYDYLDREMGPGQKYYYRLKQIDYDGRSSFSDVLVYLNSSARSIEIKDFAPNPVLGDFADLRIISPQRQRAQIDLFDAFGKLLFQKSTRLINGIHTIRIDLRNANPGSHFVRIVLENGESHYKKLVILRN